MHTDPTLEVLAHVMKSLGSNLHTFEKCTCSLFQTRELERVCRSTTTTGERPGWQDETHSQQEKYCQQGARVIRAQQRQHTKTKATKPEDLQISCPRGLC